MSRRSEHIKKLVCERLKFAVMNRADLSVLDSADVQVHVDYMTETLITAISIRILGRNVREDVKDEVVASVPEDWWQALRARWCPAWWLARWPVKMREIYATVTRQRYHVCPHIAVPKGAGHITFMTHDGGRDWWKSEEKT